ncbi:MAG: M48 family metallopeptidase [Deltaproteobacteria bacterium]|nr:M48 family metallopeptidase [Deltaproteobacteria bacterium]
MNFFDQQERTQKTTKRLILLFGLAIVAISVLNYIALQIYLSTSGIYPQVVRMSENVLGENLPPRFLWFNPKLFIYTTGITILTILLVSWIKKISLRKGGQSIAEMMGGARVAHDSQDFLEKRLLNIVEEIALASGVPVPDVYLLEEQSINAFAAGYSIDDAVIGVTRGSIESLTREELQGVIAHEFSHIFHGDMNINLHLISLLHGILFLHYIGRFIVRGSSSSHSNRRKNKDNGGIILGGIVLMVIGYVGYFFGRMIQSAISRQREYLADASAVQYTRNPQGIAGALAKIGGFKFPKESLSILQHKKADQVEHMMFSIAVMPSFMQFFASHPPIEKRIHAIDPHFNYTRAHQDFVSHGTLPEAAMGFAGQPAQPTMPLENQMLIVQEQSFLEKLDPIIYNACHHPQKAKALLYLLALEPSDTTLAQAKNILKLQDPYILHTFDQIHQSIHPDLYQHRIELFDLCMPSLRRLSKQDYRLFSTTLIDLVKMDQDVTLSEWIFVEMVKTHLHTYFYPQKKKSTLTQKEDLLDDIRVILSAVAYSGHPTSGAQMAFDKGFSVFGTPETPIIEQARITLTDIAGAFTRLQQASPKIKTTIIESIRSIVLSDDQVTWEEFELYRTFADGLGNPVKPLQISR